jgi:2-polyprenyl-3-methyl-5-hydroxy-6-metoxy-1,4-benzoquinol methylase
MEYSKMTYDSKFFIKRFTHRARYSIGLKLCRNAGSILDYGTGSAHFLKLLAEKNPTMRIVGFEPWDNMLEQAKEETKDYPNVSISKTIDFDERFDIVTCFEVLEHLTEEKQCKVFSDCKKLLKTGGRIVVSVPIETGFAGLVKNALRWIAGQPHAASFNEVIRSTFSLSIERVERGGYLHSHMGFRYKDIEKVMPGLNLIVVRRTFSPVNWFGSLLNSQVFYEIKENATDD